MTFLVANKSVLILLPSFWQYTRERPFNSYEVRHYTVAYSCISFFPPLLSDCLEKEAQGP